VEIGVDIRAKISGEIKAETVMENGVVIDGEIEVKTGERLSRSIVERLAVIDVEIRTAISIDTVVETGVRIGVAIAREISV
jgi:hypothetical protein